MRTVLFDTDPGVDDAVALAYLLSRPDCELVAVTAVHGNAPVATTADNARALLRLAGREDVPVAIGAARPLAQEPAYAPEVHGEDGLGGQRALLGPPTPPSGSRAVDEILRQSERHPGRLDILATGPLTNLALALLCDPELPRRVRSVTLMGGAFDMPGNVTHAAEANIYHDPEAADLVFAAPWPVTAVGLDVTLRVALEEEDIASLAASDHPLLAAVGRMCAHYAEFYRRFLGRRAAPQHDALAACALFAPHLFTLRRRRVRVERRGEYTRGMTVSLRGGAGEAETAVAVDVQAEEARRHILESLAALAEAGRR